MAEPVPMPESMVSMILKTGLSLFGDENRNDSLYSRLVKGGSASGTDGFSRQGITLGEQLHPYDFEQVRSFLTTNEYHAACINTKVSATVGLGLIDGQQEQVEEPAVEGQPPRVRKRYVQSKADELLNPLCDVSFADLISDAAEDFWQTGNGYIEVVRRRSNSEIVGLFHIPAASPIIFLEDDSYNYHYVIKGSESEGHERRFARFGDWADMEDRAGQEEGLAAFRVPDAQVDSEYVSEVIHFRQPTSLSKWYGFAKWLAAVPAMELAQMLMQWKYDFFQNRGVPEFIFLLVGQKLKQEDWEQIEKALKANIGLGNSHKSIALNISNPEVKAQVEKLAMESKGEDTFDTTKTSLGLSVVTAHSVPPLLAGIQIPGKLGATNELPNALAAFQLLVVGPAQRLFQQTLGATLGGEDGVAGLSVENFAFTKITEEINIGSMDTVARMRQSPMQAASEGRELDDGVKE